MNVIKTHIFNQILFTSPDKDPIFSDAANIFKPDVSNFEEFVIKHNLGGALWTNGTKTVRAVR